MIAALALAAFLGPRIVAVQITETQVVVEYEQLAYFGVCNAVVGADCVFPPTRRWREVYEVRDGKIIRVRTIEAKTIPESPERFEWPEESTKP